MVTNVSGITWQRQSWMLVNKDTSPKCTKCGSNNTMIFVENQLGCTKCNNCGNEFVTPEQLKENQKVIDQRNQLLMEHGAYKIRNP